MANLGDKIQAGIMIGGIGTWIGMNYLAGTMDGDTSLAAYEISDFARRFTMIYTPIVAIDWLCKGK